MIPLTLSGPQHRALWHKLAMIRDALGEMRSVRDHARFIGAGSLSRRRDDAEATITLAVEAIAVLLEEAACDAATKPQTRTSKLKIRLFGIWIVGGPSVQQINEQMEARS